MIPIKDNHSFIYVQLNDQAVLFLTIRFNMNNLFAHSLNVKQFYLILREDPFRCYHTEIIVDRGVMTMKGYSAFSKAPASLEPHHQIV